MSAQLIQIISFVGGAFVTGLAGYWTALQQRRQAQLATLIEALSQDNKDLRDENRKLRDELAEMERGRTRREPRHQQQP